MYLMSLVKVLERCRPKLESIDVGSVWVDNLRDDNEIRGAIAERLVFEWLSGCEDLQFDKDIPRVSGGYSLRQRRQGVIVRSLDEPDVDVFEYDFLVYRGDDPYVVEVKSQGLNGIAQQIDDKLRVASEIYSQDVGALLFFPMHSSHEDDSARICEKHPRVECVGLGYNIKRLEIALKRFRKDRSKRYRSKKNCLQGYRR